MRQVYIDVFVIEFLIGGIPGFKAAVHKTVHHEEEIRFDLSFDAWAEVDVRTRIHVRAFPCLRNCKLHATVGRCPCVVGNFPSRLGPNPVAIAA